MYFGGDWCALTISGSRLRDIISFRVKSCNDGFGRWKQKQKGNTCKPEPFVNINHTTI